MVNKRKAIITCLIFLLILLFPVYYPDQYFIHIFILFFMYTILATGWNILGGYAGQVSFGHHVFFAIGAYSSSLLVLKYGISPWIGMIVGMVISAFVALIIGLPFFRLEGHYFAIATLALGGIATAVGLNWEFIGASVGLYLPINNSGFWSMQFGADKNPYFYIALFLALFSILVSYGLTKTKPGYYFKAIRDSGEAAASIGVSLIKYKLLAFIFSAILVSMGGTFYAQYFLFINPEGVLSMDVSIQMVLMSVLGGVGTVFGPVIGAAFLVPVSELVRGLFGGTSTGVDQLIYALIIILVTTLQPAGIIGFFYKKKKREPRKFGLYKRKKEREMNV